MTLCDVEDEGTQSQGKDNKKSAPVAPTSGTYKSYFSALESVCP